MTSDESGAASARERREKSLERRIRAFHWVRLLAELPSRFAGSAHEREAAGRIADWMRELGLEEVSLAPVPSRPRSGYALALHLGLGAFGGAAGGVGGFALAALAALSFHREQRRGRALLSRVLPAPESVNVLARAGPAKPRRRIVLTAHIDSAQAGRIFARPLADLFARARPDAAPPAGPNVLPERMLRLAALVAFVSALGAEGWALSAAQLAVAVPLIFGALAGFEWGAAAPSPGANDNASAVAAMLTAAEQILAQLPDDTELWVVGTGAEEVGCCGMRALLEAHPEWASDRTWFVNFECVGGGALHWVRSEGTLEKTVYPPMLPELARRLASSGAFGDVTPVDLMAGTDGSVPAGRQLHALSLISLESNGVPRNYHRIEDVPESLDMETVIQAADFGAAVVTAALRGEADPLAIV